MKTFKKIFAAAAIGAFAILSGCSKINPTPDEMNPGKAGKYAHMTVTLSENHGIIFAPANPITAVNLDISSIEVRYLSELGTGQWIRLHTNAGIYDLLSLKNSLETILANEPKLPLGHITALRIKLGSQNTVVISGDSQHPLIVPSQYAEGIMLKAGTSVGLGDDIKVKLSIDAFSCVIKDADLYILRPYIFVESITHIGLDPGN